MIYKNIKKCLFLLAINVGLIQTSDDINTGYTNLNLFIDSMKLVAGGALGIVTYGFLNDYYYKNIVSTEVRLERIRELLLDPGYQSYESQQHYKKEEARLEQQLKEERERLQAEQVMQNQFTSETSKKLQEMIHPKKTDKQAKEENQSFFLPPKDLNQTYNNGFFSTNFIQGKNSLGKLLVRYAPPVLDSQAANNQQQTTWNRSYDPSEDSPFI
jgi:hypothetical protein